MHPRVTDSMEFSAGMLKGISDLQHHLFPHKAV